MRRTHLLAIIVIVLLLSTWSVYNIYVDKNTEIRVDIRGRVEDINTIGDMTTILVEGNLENDTYYDKAYIRVDQGTVITKNQITRKVSIAELQLGDYVEVTFKGPVAESYPVQTSAKYIHIFEIGE